MPTAGYAVHGEIAVVTLENPPVNTLAHGVRKGIAEGLEKALADPNVKAIVLTGAGNAFSGGAEIREFNTPVAMATPHLRGSHRFRSFEDVPAGAVKYTLPFEAPAGSFIAMEGRLWHTSGKNMTTDQQRRMMFAYYSTDFIRPQMNWALCLPLDVQSAMDERARKLFGITAMGNTRMGAALTRLPRLVDNESQ